MLRYVAHLSGDPQTAHDLTQDTFARAFGSLHRYEGRASARTWLLAIARRAVVDSLRRAAVRPRIADAVDWQTAVERSQPSGLPGFDEGGAVPEEPIADTIHAMAPTITTCGRAAITTRPRDPPRARNGAAATNHRAPTLKSTTWGTTGRSVPHGQAIAIISTPMAACSA